MLEKECKKKADAEAKIAVIEQLEGLRKYPRLVAFGIKQDALPKARVKRFCASTKNPYLCAQNLIQ